jgi:hypothetical protein
MFAVKYFTQIESTDANATSTVDTSSGQTDFD